MLVLLSLPLHLLSRFIPRDRNIWVFGAWFGRRYADNSRHVYEYVLENERAVRAIWLSRSGAVVASLRKSGREAYLAGSLRGFWLSCRAAVVISSNGKMDVNRPAVSGALKIQLWHGIPLKKIDREDIVPPRRGDGGGGRLASLLGGFVISIKKTLFPFLLEDWDLITSTSPLISERMASAYRVPASRVVITGYPRNDILLDNRRRGPSALDRLFKGRGFGKFILYAPTFRQRREDNAALFSSFDLEEFAPRLKRHNALFMIKMHPSLDAEALMAGQASGENVYWVKEKDVSELNELLPDIDVLITDYSGAYLDYLLLDRPVIFAPFDLERYLKNDRELYEDYGAATPGVKCGTWTKVFNNLDRILAGEDLYKGERQLALKKYHLYRDSGSSKRVFELARSHAGAGPR